MAVIAAHAIKTSTAAPGQGAQSAATPADKAALFAELLSEMVGAKAEAVDPETLLDPQKPEGDSKKKDDPEIALPVLAEIPVQSSRIPAQLSDLPAKEPAAQDKAQREDELPKPAIKLADDKSGDVAPSDEAKDAGSKILPDGRPAAASDTAKDNKNNKNVQTTLAPDKAFALNLAASVSPDAPAVPVMVDAVSPKPESGAEEDGKVVSAATQTVKPAVQINDAITAQLDLPAADDGKEKTANEQPDIQRTSDPATPQNMNADKLALAVSMDKDVRQALVSQDETRVLPPQTVTVGAASTGTNSNQPDKDGSGSPSTNHAGNDSTPQTKVDGATPASLTQASTANLPQTPVQTAIQLDHSQVVGPGWQSHTTAPVVTASLQVAPQTAQPQPEVTGLALQIAAKSEEGVKHFDIRLDPPELGRVEVKLSIDDTGQAQAHLAVEKPQTLHMLQNDRGGLERALKDSGLDLAQNGLNFSLKGQDRQNGQPQPLRGRSLAVRAAIESATAAVSATTAAFAAGQTRLDIRV